MAKSKIKYQSNEEIIGKHLRSNEWISYVGKLSVYERKNYPVVLSLKSDYIDSFIAMTIEEEKTFKGNSISEVFGKLAKWFYKRGIIFQN